MTQIQNPKQINCQSYSFAQRQYDRVVAISKVMSSNNCCCFGHCLLFFGAYLLFGA